MDGREMDEEKKTQDGFKNLLIEVAQMKDFQQNYEEEAKEAEAQSMQAFFE